MTQLITVKLGEGQTEEELAKKIRALNLANKGEEQALARDLVRDGVNRSRYLASMLAGDYEVRINDKLVLGSTPVSARGKEDVAWSNSSNDGGVGKPVDVKRSETPERE